MRNLKQRNDLEIERINGGIIAVNKRFSSKCEQVTDLMTRMKKLNEDAVTFKARARAAEERE
jgi:hypothetical protein